MALGNVGKNVSALVMNGRKGAMNVPNRDATASVAAKIGGSSSHNGITRHSAPCRACGGKK